MSLFDTTSLFPLKPRESVYSMIRFPVQPAAVLLKRDSSRGFLETLQVILSPFAYHEHYYPAIEQFVNYVQVIPARQQGLFSEIEGLLNYSLSRATYTLTTSLSHLYPTQKSFHQLQHSSMQSAELYAVFTAALFKDISLLMQHYAVSLYDQNEKELAPWQPFETSIIDTKAAFLSFRYLEEPRTLNLLNGSLTSVILSNHQATRAGFLSIAQYPELLEHWLAVLGEQSYRVPPDAVISLIPFGEKQAVDKRLQEVAHLKQQTKDPDKKKLSAYKNQLLGEQFINWLRKRAKANEIAINANDSLGLRRTKEGVLIARAELIAFSERYRVNPETIEQQFREIVSLYPASTNERAKQSSSLGGVAQVALGQWLIAHNPALIFSLGRMPPIFTASPLASTTFRESVNYINPVK